LDHWDSEDENDLAVTDAGTIVGFNLGVVVAYGTVTNDARMVF
jgi:hypothetical protein